MPRGSLRRGLLRVGAWVDPATSIFRGGFLLALALGGRWSLLPPLLNDCGLCEGRRLPRGEILFWDQVSGFYLLRFSLVPWGRSIPMDLKRSIEIGHTIPSSGSGLLRRRR